MRIRTSRYKPFMKGAPPLDYRLYLFDFDYTLVNSEPAIVKCFHITLQKLGYPDVPDERIKKTIGLPMVEAVKRIVGTADDAEAERFVDAYRPEADRYMTPGTTFFPGAVETLRAIKATGAKVGIISNKTHRRIQEKFDVDHVPELIDLIIGIYLVAYPMVSMEIIPFLIAFWLMFRGFSATGYSMDLKRYGTRDWGWYMAFGILAILCSLLILWQPAVGALYAVYMISFTFLIIGFFRFMLAFELKNLHKRANN